MTIKHKSIGPCDVLNPGTKISVSSSGSPLQKGQVTKAIQSKDQFGCLIYVHEVMITEKYDYGNRKWKRIKDKTKKVNYASIYLIP